MAKKEQKASKKTAHHSAKKEIRDAQLSQAKGGTNAPYQNVKSAKRS